MVTTTGSSKTTFAFLFTSKHFSKAGWMSATEISGSGFTLAFAGILSVVLDPKWLCSSKDARNSRE